MLDIKLSVKNPQIYKYSTLLALVIMLAQGSVVSAEELIISGNGSGSVSEVTATNTKDTDISQTNNTDINNNVQTESNTGQNSTSDNSGGDVSIQTGDILTETEITNSGNANNIITECCNNNASGSAAIIGNGTNSENIVNITNASIFNATLNNTAIITNIITGSANTGQNQADDNTNGNVTIKTGNIRVLEDIINGPLNINSSSSVLNGNINQDNYYTLKINGNGSYSQNSIHLNLNNQDDIKVLNALNILNESLWLLNTGQNSLSGNSGGDVNLLTGDIEFLAKFFNGPVNINQVEIKCCETNEPNADTNPVDPPIGGITPPSAAKVDEKPAETKSGDGSKAGEVLAAAIGAILPVTGSYNFFLFLIGNVAMFLLGMVLRLRSGRSPGATVVL